MASEEERTLTIRVCERDKERKEIKRKSERGMRQVEKKIKQ